MSDLLDRLRALAEAIKPERTHEGFHECDNCGRSQNDFEDGHQAILEAVERLQPAQTPPERFWCDVCRVSRCPSTGCTRRDCPVEAQARFRQHADPPAQTPDRPSECNHLFVTIQSAGPDICAWCGTLAVAETAQKEQTQPGEFIQQHRRDFGHICPLCQPAQRKD